MGRSVVSDTYNIISCHVPTVRRLGHIGDVAPKVNEDQYRLGLGMGRRGADLVTFINFPDDVGLKECGTPTSQQTSQTSRLTGLALV